MDGPQVPDVRLACPKCAWNHLPELQPLPEALYKGDCRRCGAAITFRPSDTLLAQEITINGKQYTVSESHKALSLNGFIRDVARLPGTKFMCNEGGCGCCVVAATVYDEVAGREKTMAVNSCLQPMRGCLGWKVETIEGLGNQKDGLHPIQQRVADNNATQCGYCTPGMVMNMYSLLKANDGQVTQQQVEDSFDGNICRCTGYRPILDTMKSFATDSTNGAIDIEELASRIQCCQKNGQACTKPCSQKTVSSGPVIPVPLQDALWQTPHSLEELRSVLKATAGQKVRLVAGNTGIGAYKNDGPFDTYINIRGLAECRESKVDVSGVTIGASMCITEAIAVVEKAANNKGFTYLSAVIKHFKRIGSLPIRNAATLGGNFTLKYDHREMPSDVFVVFECLQVKVNVVTVNGETLSLTPAQFLATDMAQKFILSFTMGPLTNQDYFKSSKIAQRSQNCAPYVNSAFRMRLDRNSNYKVLEKPAIVFGNISTDFTHAVSTEDYLVGKELADDNTIQGALKVLDSDLTPNGSPGHPSAEYRRRLAKGLLYKFILKVCGDKVSEQFRSGGEDLIRPLSSGSQEFQTDESVWPLNQPLMSVSAGIQASGEAEYSGNIPIAPDQLYAHFVLTTLGNATLDKIDATEALAMPGVVRFLTVDDMPEGGVNNFMPINPYYSPEEVLCSGQVLYAGQPLGIIVADSAEAASAASKKVHVTYRDVKKPILTPKEAIEQDSFFPKMSTDTVKGNPESALASSFKVVTGTVEVGRQFHFHMETQTIVCLPRDNGLDVHASSQWIDSVQQAVAQFLGIQNSQVHVQVKRVGGGFGGKVDRTNMAAAGCALACRLLNRPVRCQLSLADNMSMMGGRDAVICKYKNRVNIMPADALATNVDRASAGVNEEGKLQAIKTHFFADVGCSPNDAVEPFMLEFADVGAYDCDNWEIVARSLKTNTPGNTWMRAPGAVYVAFAYDTIMEHMAKELDKDPLEFRKMNLLTDKSTTLGGDPVSNCHLTTIVGRLEDTAQVQQRKKEVQDFNKQNRWKKKGLSVVPLRFGAVYNIQPFHVQISIYNGDGSVAITHGGVEIGQGINTKVIQVCARELGIPVSKITVRPTDTMSSSNSSFTGSSTTSELNCLGVIDCCKQLNERLKNYPSKLPKDAPWADRVQEYYLQNGDLAARAWVANPAPETTAYHMYAATCTEVEMDVLTGEYLINRVDLLYDCGRSMNPAIDIGQIEGAFVMGLGYFLSEKITHHPVTGMNLSNSTWTYLPPTTKDIPVDFRIALLRDTPNPSGVLSAKSSGEPPLVMSSSAVFALRDAIHSARADAGDTSYCHIDAPATLVNIQPKCLTKDAHFTLGGK